jgi:hypothetical protein
MLIKDKKLISHELLTEVLGNKAWQMTGNNIDFLLNTRENDIVFERTSETQYLIDSDKLGRLCKEWALEKGYELFSVTQKSDKGCGYCEIWFGFRCIENFREETELIAIIKACEWILENTRVKSE